MTIDPKLPSPDDVKKSPTKFSKTELEEIQNLQEEISSITFQLGQLSISKIRIEEQDQLLKEKLNNSRNKEIQLAKKLSSKYGKGSLNLDTGEFSPLK